ncbi:hypothetical protein KFK09_022467 [Dendrobium nobile]|uniref:Uncharacterized protein n=1 Tax=Dendrobium nobile TaxID=94219 RepID=A0A8T3AJ83_DENNO|nr:hypothetical protein KFK09_022467 [Dendrobium nobile]
MASSSSYFAASTTTSAPSPRTTASSSSALRRQQRHHHLLFMLRIFHGPRLLLPTLRCQESHRFLLLPLPVAGVPEENELQSSNRAKLEPGFYNAS